MLNLSIKRKMILIMVGVATITPTILVALLASTYYYLGIESFFNEQVSDAIGRTSDLAQLYIDEHKENVKMDALFVANSIERNYAMLENQQLLTLFLDKQSENRGIAEIMLFTKNRVIAHNSLGLALVFERLPLEMLNKADHDIIILREGLENRVRAIAKLRGFLENTYVLVGRYTDQEIVNHLQKTKGSAAHYEVLLGNIKFTRDKLAIAFIILSGVLCFVVVLIAIKVANLISRPIEQLAEATSQIKGGDFSVRVPEGNQGKNEIALLAKAFNTMTERISYQRSELIQAKETIDSRRRFIEAVLSELSAGVIAIDINGMIVLSNNSASDLLDINLIDSKVHFLSVFREIEELIQEAKIPDGNKIYDHIIIKRNGIESHLLVKVGMVFNSQKNIENFIVTFNDITELVSAQRTAAWADVARRIAHEIKNPLTPIQLAAERIKVKYLSQSTEDMESISRYTDTIIKNVKDIEQMVVEFVEFARLPAPKIKSYRLHSIIDEAILLQKTSNPMIEYKIISEDSDHYVLCDRSQIARIFNNLLKNAAESIHNHNHDARGVITVKTAVDKNNNAIIIEISDTGSGIDSEIMNRITEPYVTTKKKGTGLGLSIVKKIIEDHKSKLIIENIKGSGAKFSFFLNITDKV